MILLKGLPASQKIHTEIKTAIAKGGFTRKPCLAAVLTTNNPASHTYVARKVKACQEVGIMSKVFQKSPESTQELLDLIDTLNEDTSIDGILIQLPLPPHIELLQVLERIDPTKDVDGFHPLNCGKVLLQDPTAFYPCTPLGIKVLLEHYKIQVAGQHVVIVGRSNIVGKPLAALLLQNAQGCNATVTVAHSHTKQLPHITKTADILVAAMGQPHAITADMVKKGAVVIDVGINTIADPTAVKGSKIVGDVDFASVMPHVAAISPVPGGVGPMTIAMLLKNTYKAFLSHA